MSKITRVCVHHEISMCCCKCICNVCVYIYIYNIIYVKLCMYMFIMKSACVAVSVYAMHVCELQLIPHTIKVSVLSNT